MSKGCLFVVLMVFQGIFRDVFKEVLIMLPESLKEVKRYFKENMRVFQKSFDAVLSEFQ